MRSSYKFWCFAALIALSAQSHSESRTKAEQMKAGATASPSQDLKKVSPPEYREVFDFRGVRLGMTPQEFKKVPIPKEAVPSYPPSIPGLRSTSGFVRPECSNDAEASKEVRYVENRDLGIVECAWIVHETTYTELTRKSILYAADSGVKNYFFKFIALPGEQPKLFAITMETRVSGHANLIRALTAKFGEPQSVSKDVVQNGMGVSLENDTRIWENSSGQILVKQWSYDLETGLLAFVLTKHFGYYDELLKAKKAKEDPKI